MLYREAEPAWVVGFYSHSIGGKQLGFVLIEFTNGDRCFARRDELRLLDEGER